MPSTMSFSAAWVLTLFAFFITPVTAAPVRLARMPMIVMTTSISIKVKARCEVDFSRVFMWTRKCGWGF